MASLYEINQAVMDCLDAETGEIIDPEKLENLLMERDQKIENVALWIKNLLADADAIKTEKEALAAREAKCRRRAAQLKAWLGQILHGQKFSTPRCAISFRKSTTLDVYDAKRVPAEYLVETVSTSPDANRIKEILMSGQEVSGCRLVENLNTQIK